MKWGQVICLFFLFVCGCGTKTPEDHKQEIKEQNKQLEEALNQKDAKQFASLWDDSAMYVNVTTHETVKGKDAITDYFKTLFLKGATFKVTIDEIEVSDDQIATELGKIQLQYKDRPQEERAFKAIYIYRDGQWVLQKLIEADFLQTSTHYAHLKELEWLIGTWEDASDWVDVVYKFGWETNKNFIHQDFKMKILGEEELSGKQIIGWDPVEKAIRSWIFDSDGGFGGGKWSKEGDTWYVSVSFTLSDGRIATALHSYKKVNEDTYTFTTVDRDVGGKILPDTGPFKIVRKR